MNISIVVCAAGKGERAGYTKNKLLVPYSGANALYHTLCAFGYIEGAQKIAVCAGDEEALAICKALGWQTVTGGATRTESVYNALKEVTGDIVVIHDGARPFVTKDIIDECIACAGKHGSAVCALPSTDTVALSADGRIDAVPKRSTVYLLQTPQCFNAKELKEAYERAISDGGQYTDDSSVYSRYIRPAKICPCGTAANKKLTIPSDLTDAFRSLTDGFAVNGNARIGLGTDVHAFGKEQNFVTLCGVKIPADKGLIAHSDGDVAVHALMDAMLSGAGLKDIGYYFPDTDQRFAGADSVELLKEVARLIKERGYTLTNAVISIQAERPKIMPHADEMKATLAAALDIGAEKISISAGTNEGLGFVGSGAGILVYSAVLLEKVK